MPIDMSAAKAPPKKSPATPRKPATPAPTAAPPSLNEMRTEGLLGLAQLAQGVCLMTGQYADALTIGKFFPPVAKEIANIADDNETIAGPIDFIIKVGPYGALVAAGLPMVLQFLANHKIIDASRMLGQGVVPPAVLEAQMKAEIANMQAMALIEQQRAIDEANEATARFNAMVSNPGEATTS